MTSKKHLKDYPKNIHIFYIQQFDVVKLLDSYDLIDLDSLSSEFIL